MKIGGFANVCFDVLDYFAISLDNFSPMPGENLATISIEDDALNDDEYSSNRLFVSNFPFSWTEKELRDFMKE